MSCGRVCGRGAHAVKRAGAARKVADAAHRQKRERAEDATTLIPSSAACVPSAAATGPASAVPTGMSAVAER